jgi:integrase
MALRLKTQRDGKTLRPYWYGAYVEDGKQKVVTLSVKWKGTPPASGRVGDAGDEVFERSREKAAAALADFVNESKRKGRADTLTERLIESKTGREVVYCRIADLPDRWRALGRESTPTGRYLSACDAHFKRFIDFMATRNPKAVHLYQVTEADAAAFVEACRLILAPGTARDCMQLLNTAFARFLPVGASNPFGALMGRRGNGKATIVHRQPFTPDELRALLETARDDSFMFPLIVCAAMTGMRRGDVCNLKWSAVDMAGGMLSVKTSKTDSSVEIPIFPMLREVLIEAGGKGKGYVFPDAAKMLKENPDGLTWRFKKIVARAFEGDKAALSDRTPAADVLDQGTEAIREHIADSVRAARMVDVLTRYAEGQSVRVIEKETGIARATISNDLRTVEIWTGRQFVRSNAGVPGIKSRVNKLTRVAREQGQRAASVRDWHALRVTWITFALAAGVPMELVRRVTGHATVDVVLKHYFRPDREQFRAALSGALPDVLTGNGNGKPKRLTAGDELAGLVGKVQAGTATDKDKKRLRLLAAKV